MTIKLHNTLMRDKLLALFTTKQAKRPRKVNKLPEVITVKRYELNDGSYVGSKIDKQV
jgi:hypothetical protein